METDLHVLGGKRGSYTKYDKRLPADFNQQMAAAQIYKQIKKYLAVNDIDKLNEDQIHFLAQTMRGVLQK